MILTIDMEVGYRREMRTYLDLNKERIRRDVALRLQILGYEVDQNVGIRTIQAIIRKIQSENNLVADGYIGKCTIPLLGYSDKEIKRMLKISTHNEKEISFEGFIYLLLS